VLAVAFCVGPNEAGYGTHRKLALPACSFLTQSGYPCPSCGLTTSMSAMAHGRVGLALAAQPFGVVLFLAATVLAAVGAGEACTGRNFLGVLRPGLWWVWTGLGGLFAGWAWKLAAGMAAGVYPLR